MIPTFIPASLHRSGFERSDPESLGRRALNGIRWLNYIRSRNRTQADDVTVALFLLLIGVLFDQDGFIRAALHFRGQYLHELIEFFMSADQRGLIVTFNVVHFSFGLFLIHVDVLLNNNIIAAALHIAVLLFPELVRIVVQDLLRFVQ